MRPRRSLSFRFLLLCFFPPWTFRELTLERRTVSVCEQQARITCAPPGTKHEVDLGKSSGYIKHGPLSDVEMCGHVCHLNKYHCLIKYKSGEWLIAKALRHDKLESWRPFRINFIGVCLVWESWLWGGREWPCQVKCGNSRWF